MRNSVTASRLFSFILVLVVATLPAGGCGGIKINVGADSKEPLKEFTIEGRERGKVLVVPVRGFISDAPRKSLLGDRASLVQEVVSQLRMAEKDGTSRPWSLR